MAKTIKKKSAKEASTTFHDIKAASVKGNPKPSINIVEAERFHRSGKDYIILVIKYGDTLVGEAYQQCGKYKPKKGEGVSDILAACRKGIDASA